MSEFKTVGENVTRFELIDRNGRVVVHYDAQAFDVRVAEQDGARTVKVYIGCALHDEGSRLREQLAKVSAQSKERGATIERLEKMLGRHLDHGEHLRVYDRGYREGVRVARLHGSEKAALREVPEK
jgi:hypothetical protein